MQLRPASDRDEDVVGVERLGRPVLLDLHDDARVLDRCTGDLRSDPEVESLPTQDTVGFLHDVVVVARKDGRHELHDRHLRAEPSPDRAELETDHPATDDHQVTRDFREGERADVGEDATLVERQEGKGRRYRAGRDDHVARLIARHVSVGGGHVDAVAGPQRSGAARPSDLVLPKEKLDAARVGRDDLVLALEHLREVEPQPVEGESMLVCVQARELVVLRGLQERLARDAADVDARAAERLVHLHTDRGEAELCSANGRDVSAGAATDHDHIGGHEFIRHRERGGGSKERASPKLSGCGRSSRPHPPPHRDPLRCPNRCCAQAARVPRPARDAAKRPLRSVFRQLCTRV